MMRLLETLVMAAALAGMCAGQTAPLPAAKVIKVARVEDHRMGPDDALHFTAKEVEEREKIPHAGNTAYFEFEVVVSEYGLVESAKPVKPAGSYASAFTEPHAEEALATEKARRYKPWMEDGVPIRVQIEDSVMVYPPERRGPEIAFPEKVDRKTLAMTLERKSGGWGGGAAYEVMVAGDGLVTYSSGMERHTAHLSDHAVTDLLAQFRRADFLSALPEYESEWSDQSTQIVTLRMGDRVWRVKDYDGLRDGLPLAVRELEGAIDRVTETERWLSGDHGKLAMPEEVSPDETPAKLFSFVDRGHA